MKISMPVFKSLAALSLGTLGLCMSEFSMMGVLPEAAASLHCGTAESGHFISAYALGVCAGAIACAFLARKVPLKETVIFLMGLFIAGNLLTVAATGKTFMLCARFTAGLPHGAYFGVASIMAAALAGPAYAVLAISIALFGATIANLAGVPFSTFAAWAFSWRVAYMIIGCIGFIAIFAIIRYVPKMAPLQDRGALAQFRFLRSPSPWLIIGAIVLGNGGMFCWYSYISAYMREISGIPAAWMAAIMVLAGSGMVLGNILSGELSKKLAAVKIAIIFQLAMAAALCLLFFTGADPWLSCLFLFIAAGCLFGLSAPQQLLMLVVSPGGRLPGASMAQVGFNLGNALGAWTGGRILSCGLSIKYTPLPGIFFALCGFALLFIWLKKYGKKTDPGQKTQ